MNTDKGDHAQICMKEPERKTFSRTYYNSTTSTSTEVPTNKIKKREVCRFFTAGLCTKGLDCSYSHEIPVCEHFLKNKCIFGDECWKLHPAVEKTEKRAKPEKKVSHGGKNGATKRGGDSAPTKKCPGSKSKPSIVNVLTNQSSDGGHASICTYHEEGYYKYGNTCNNLYKKEQVEPSDASSGTVDVICEHFQRGACAYGDACWKVHVKPEVAPPPPRTKAVKKDITAAEMQSEAESPICEHYQKGICAYGDSCFKKHVKMPLYKDPYGPTTEDVDERKVLPIHEYSVDDLFLSDSESEENIVVPKHSATNSSKQARKQPQKPKTSPQNLFEVLVSNDREANSSSDDESDEENKYKSQTVDKLIQKNPPIAETVLTNAEKKKLKKDTKRKKAEMMTKEKIDNLKESGNKDFKVGNYSLAVKQYTEAIKLCGSNNPMPGIINNRCAAYILLDKFQNALKDGRKVIEFEPNNVKAHTRILKCCLALGKVEEGRKSVSKIVDADPEVEQMKTDLENVDKLHRKATELASKKNFKSAIESINQGLKLSPYSVLFITLKAKFYAMEKNIVSARKALAKLDMKDQNVKTSLYHFVVGLCFYYEDDLERAISGFGEAKKEVSEAKEWHDKALAMHNAFISGNRVLRTGGSYASAINSFDKGLAMDKENSVYMAKMFYTRALLNTKYERFEAAVGDCTNTIKYDSHHYKAFAKRGSLYLELQKYEEAVTDLEEAHRLKPSPEALRALEDAKRRKAKNEKRKPSHYQVLGVDKRATYEEIKKAYRAKAREFHPDKHANASKEEQDLMEAKMKEISAANQCLSDSVKKEQYDRKLERMLRNDDSDMEDYDSDEECDFGFDVDDFFFHIFGIYVSGRGNGGRFSSRIFRR